MIKINGKIEWEEIGEMVDLESETEYTAWVTGTDDAGVEYEAIRYIEEGIIEYIDEVTLTVL